MYRLLLGVLVAISAGSPVPKDVTGSWMFKMNPDFRGNPGILVECKFSQRQAALTVRCGETGGEMKGTVRDGKLTWGFEKTGIPPVVQDRLVVTYIGEQTEPDRIVGTWLLVSGFLDKKGEFEATRKPRPRTG
jgi:hypothetical protein